MTQTLDRPAGPADRIDPTDGTDPATARVQGWLADLESALTAGDVHRAAGLFTTDSYWRDLIAFTWNLTTVEGRAGIEDMLTANAARVGSHGWRVTEGEAAVEAGGVTQAWTLLTILYELTGHEEPSGTQRPLGAEHGAQKGRASWSERREQEAAELGTTTSPYVLVVGGGQGGIALGARLRQLGVPSIIIDKRERPGDQWRSRYKSLCLHDPVWYDHLPYLKFPDSWPVFAPKDKIADWLESYTKVMAGEPSRPAPR